MCNSNAILFRLCLPSKEHKGEDWVKGYCLAASRRPAEEEIQKPKPKKLKAVAEPLPSIPWVLESLGGWSIYIFSGFTHNSHGLRPMVTRPHMTCRLQGQKVEEKKRRSPGWAPSSEIFQRIIIFPIFFAAIFFGLSGEIYWWIIIFPYFPG